MHIHPSLVECQAMMQLFNQVLYMSAFYYSLSKCINIIVLKMHSNEDILFFLKIGKA